MPGSQSCSERGDLVDDGPGLVSSTEMCKQLYTEAVDRGIRVNGKLCNAVMVGFGSDLTVSKEVSATRTTRNVCSIVCAPSFFCPAVVHYLAETHDCRLPQALNGRCRLMPLTVNSISRRSCPYLYPKCLRLEISL